MNANLINLRHENFTEANKGNKDQFFVNFVAFCKVVLWIAGLGLMLGGGVTAQTLTTLYSFTPSLVSYGGMSKEYFTNGANPFVGLAQASDGYFYGTTSSGGASFQETGSGTSGYGWGTMFKISTDGALTTLVSYVGAGAPISLAASDGYIYGTTGGGDTLFIWGVNAAPVTGYSFTGTNDGAAPDWLTPGSDGYFYGTTYEGGTNGGYGTLFKISTNGALTSLYSFTGGTDGANPNGLVQGSDGYFYGTTGGGSYTNQYGTVFKISTNGALTSLYSFTGGTDGADPNGLVQGNDGYFYGTTGGGTYTNQYGTGYGTVFRISTNGALSSLYSFTGGTDGGSPNGLVQGSDGYFYGTTQRGAYNSGTVFKITTNGALTSLYSFTGGTDGGYPVAGLVQGSDGSFYGTTYGGGQDDGGTVFRLTIVPEFQGATISNEMINLTWSTEAGGTYQLQYTSDLASTNWIDLQSAFVATGPSMTTTDWVFDSPQRFYRLQIIFGHPGAFDCVVSGPQPDYYSFLIGLQALAEAYGLEYTLQSLLGAGGGTGLYDVMTLDPNGCVIAYCNANLQWGCFLGQTSSDCTIASGPELPVGLPVIAWGAKAPCSGEHVFQW